MQKEQSNTIFCKRSTANKILRKKCTGRSENGTAEASSGVGFDESNFN